MEEPTSPDDILGHARIRAAVEPVRIATGEHCQNRIIFKQLLQAGAIDVCQIDSCRVAGVNENLAIMLMAAKFKVPVCPHAGGVGPVRVRAASLGVRLHLRLAHPGEPGDRVRRSSARTLRRSRAHPARPVHASHGAWIQYRNPRGSLERYQFPDGAAWSEEPVSVADSQRMAR